MIAFLVLLGLLIALGALGTVREGLRDRPREVPRSRFVPPDLQPPADNGGRGLDIRHWVA